MEFDVKKMRWTREPESYSIADGKIEITTKPGTDLWQRTYYTDERRDLPNSQAAILGDS